MVLQSNKFRFCGALGCAALTSLLVFFLLIQPTSLRLHSISKAELLETGESIQLPYYSERSTSDTLLQFSYLIELTKEVPKLLRTNINIKTEEPVTGLIFLQMINGADVYLNDTWITGLPKSTTTERWLWYRPMLVPLPLKLLNNDSRPDIIKVVQSTHEPYVVISRPFIGNMFDLSLVYEVVNFLSSTLANASNFLCLVVGLFLIAAWFISPNNNSLGLAGAAAILWAVLFTLALWTYMPMNFHSVWRVIVYFITGGLIVLMSFFVLSFIGEPLRKLGTWLLVGYASIAPIVYSVGGSQTESILNKFWIAPMLMVYAYACIRLIIYFLRVKSTLSFALLFQSIICMMLAYHDYAILTGGFSSFISADPQWSWGSLFFEPIYLTHIGFPFLILIMGYVFMMEFQVNVDSIKNQNTILSESLKSLTVELDCSYESHKRIERLDAARLERERIYQDIHDGIGSRLVTAIFSIRNGNIQSSSVETQLLDCLSDLRLVINSESDTDTDIQSAIFQYCSNQESLLYGDKFSFVYDISDGPEIYQPLQNRLNILRILQETLTNIIKHANATQVRVKFEQNETEGTLYISDNGKGLSTLSSKHAVTDYGLSGGKGLIGMASRASKIGGTFSLNRIGLWTIASLKFPLQSTDDR
jgi:signal transduction histidine kinase